MHSKKNNRDLDHAAILSPDAQSGDATLHPDRGRAVVPWSGVNPMFELLEEGLNPHWWED